MDSSTTNFGVVCFQGNELMSVEPNRSSLKKDPCRNHGRPNTKIVFPVVTCSNFSFLTNATRFHFCLARQKGFDFFPIPLCTELLYCESEKTTVGPSSLQPPSSLVESDESNVNRTQFDFFRSDNFNF